MSKSHDPTSILGRCVVCGEPVPFHAGHIMTCTPTIATVHAGECKGRFDAAWRGMLGWLAWDWEMEKAA